MKILRAALAAFLVPLSLAAAGHDVSSVRYAPSALYAGAPAIAFNGNHFLTLWAMSFHIYGSIADSTGTALAPAFPAVPFALSNVLQLTAAGSGYAAIWNQDTKPFLGSFDANGTLVRRVAVQGDSFVAPRTASNGTNILVVDRNAGIAGSVYDLNGRSVGGFPLPVFVSDSFAVTTDGSDFIVVTAGRSGINEWRVAADGTIVSTSVIEAAPLHPNSVYDIAVAAKNGRIAMAWTQRGFTTVSSAVIQPDGRITRYALASGLGPVSGVAILPVDAGFLVAWNEQRTLTQVKVVAALLDGSGAPIGVRPADLGDGPFTSAASSANAVAVTLFTAAQTAILAADVNANGISPRTPVPIAVTPVRQLFPVVAGNGAGFTAAWLDWSADTHNAAAGRVTPRGEALDGPGINLGETGPPGTPLAIAHGPSGELIVWTANGHLVAGRLTPFGVALDATPIVIASLPFPSSVTCSVAWNGSRFFVVWTDGTRLIGSFVGSDGVATPPRVIGIQLPPNTFPIEPDVAWDGRQFIVVYGEVPPHVCVEGCIPQAVDIRVLRVSADGIAIDTDPVRIPGFHAHAHVASSGTESLIALDSNTDTSAMIVREQNFLLQLGPEIPLFHWLNTFGSDVTWTGSLYVVAWRYEFLQTQPGWIGVSRISQQGVPFGSLYTPAAGPAENASPLSTPSVASNDAGEAAVVISEMAPPTYVARGRLYLMSELAPMPVAPRPPRNAVMERTGAKITMSWQSDGPNDGFFIEASSDSGRNWFPAAVTAGEGITILSGYPASYLFRVRAIGPGGLSEPAAATVVIVDRRRAVRR